MYIYTHAHIYADNAILMYMQIACTYIYICIHILFYIDVCIVKLKSLGFFDSRPASLANSGGLNNEFKRLKGTLSGTPKRESQEYSRNIQGIYLPGSLCSIIFLLYS